MSDDASLNAASVIGLALIVLVHLAITRFRFLDDSSSAWLDILAGVALGYVFVDLLPHLAGFQEKLAPLTDAGVFGFLQHHSYLMAMAGVLFYLAICLSGEQARSSGRGAETNVWQLPIATLSGAFSLAAYAFLVGYLLSERLTHGAGSTLSFAIAMSAHFVGLDHFYRQLYPRFYDAAMRYVLTAATCAGWALGVVSELSDLVYAMWFSFLAGGLMIVTAIFELPRIRSWRPYAGFCVGAVGFSVLVLTVEALRN
jgi:hypothetical protein